MISSYFFIWISFSGEPPFRRTSISLSTVILLKYSATIRRATTRTEIGIKGYALQLPVDDPRKSRLWHECDELHFARGPHPHNWRVRGDPLAVGPPRWRRHASQDCKFGQDGQTGFPNRVWSEQGLYYSISTISVSIHYVCIITKSLFLYHLFLFNILI